MAKDYAKGSQKSEPADIQNDEKETKAQSKKESNSSVRIGIKANLNHAIAHIKKQHNDCSY